jgi:hypothetical protein
MSTRALPRSRVTRPRAAAPAPMLHLLAGRWIASCPNCGYELAESRDQRRCERRAARRRCPICHQAGGQS